jgi:uncharacterized membrane protein YciS (DUF1049 family)
MSIAIWLLLSLALGMCLSAFIYSVVLLKLKRQNTRLERRLSLISSTSKDPKVTV